MNRKLLLLISCSVLVLIASFTVVAAERLNAPKTPQGTAMGTAFTYQGQLKKNGSPVTSSCNFRFTLYDAASSGGVMAGPVNGNPNPVSVTDGSFVVDIDFGGNAFNGEARWLMTETQCTGDGGYTALNPLQELTPAPYALALPGLYTQQNIASTNVIGGYSGNNVTSGVYGATIGGGNLNSASNHYATVPGGAQASASHYGEMAYASGGFFASGDAQTSVYVLRNTSTYTYTTELFLAGSNATQRITIANDRTVTFDILVSARTPNTGVSAGYRAQGVIKNVSGLTTLLGTVTPVSLGADAGATAWSCSVKADDTHDALVVKVVGAGANPINWVASVRTSEVAY